MPAFAAFQQRVRGRSVLQHEALKAFVLCALGGVVAMWARAGSPAGRLLGVLDRVRDGAAVVPGADADATLHFGRDLLLRLSGPLALQSVIANELGHHLLDAVWGAGPALSGPAPGSLSTAQLAALHAWLLLRQVGVEPMQAALVYSARSMRHVGFRGDAPPPLCPAAPADAAVADSAAWLAAMRRAGRLGDQEAQIAGLLGVAPPSTTVFGLNGRRTLDDLNLVLWARGADDAVLQSLDHDQAAAHRGGSHRRAPGIDGLAAVGAVTTAGANGPGTRRGRRAGGGDGNTRGDRGQF